MTKLITLVSALALSTSAFAGNPYFGSINNNTGQLIECSEVVGGYCANNPMPANGYIQMLPDPGSTVIRGHIMVFDPSVPGKYTDNLLFTYSEQKDHSWAFDIHSLDGKVKVTSMSPDTVVLSMANGEEKTVKLKNPA